MHISITRTLAHMLILAGLGTSCSKKEFTTILVDDESKLFAQALKDSPSVKFIASNWPISSEAFHGDTMDLLLRIPTDVLSTNSVELVFKDIPEPEVREFLNAEIDRIARTQRETNSTTPPRILVRMHDLETIELHQ